MLRWVRRNEQNLGTGLVIKPEVSLGSQVKKLEGWVESKGQAVGYPGDQTRSWVRKPKDQATWSPRASWVSSQGVSQRVNRGISQSRSSLGTGSSQTLPLPGQRFIWEGVMDQMTLTGYSFLVGLLGWPLLGPLERWQAGMSGLSVF